VTVIEMRDTSAVELNARADILSQPEKQPKDFGRVSRLARFA
jgi:hypothetical protein